MSSQATANDTLINTAQSESSPVLQRTNGAELRAHREAKGWTIDHVAAQLKLAPRQVQAIETDNYGMLPGMVVVRGFIRSYAKLLKIDAAPLLARMSVEQTGFSSPLQQQRTFARPFKPTAIGVNRSRNLGLTAVALAIVVVSAAVFYLNADLFGRIGNAFSNGISDLSNSWSIDRSTGKTATPAVTDVTALVAPEPAAVQSASTVVPVTEPATPGTFVSAPMSGESANGVSAAPATATENLLQLAIKSDSWIEVKRVDSGEILAARLVPAGTVETFEIDAPVAVTIGNVAGVNASFRGTSLALGGNSSSNVARFTLK